jgi:manganese transport protein
VNQQTNGNGTMRLPLFSKFFSHNRPPQLGAFDFIRYIGPGFLVAVGFIDPGNWASDLAAGSQYGYALLWVVTLSTMLLIVLQHNAAHLGIVTGHCLAESVNAHLRPFFSRPILGTAVVAIVATAFAEVLGAAIALNLLFGVQLKIGAVLAAAFVGWMLYSNSYKKIERWIIGFVSLIGIAFVIELSMVHVHWAEAVRGSIVPAVPHGSMLVIMSVLGAVVMPHNLFLHSEIIQSRRYNTGDAESMRHTLRYEFLDTLLSMVIGWAINSAIILLAVALFFNLKVPVTGLEQAQRMLQPLLGSSAAVVFAIALLCSGISSSVTAGMAGGTIIAGMAGESYDIRDGHTKLGVGLTLVCAVAVTFFVTDTFKALIVSQMLLSVQLPVTIFTQVHLTSSKKVMGTYANNPAQRVLLWLIGGMVTVFNVMLLWDAVQ